mmetsp:Transcript_600/g.1881  ORF Transcript_600/g.1881 Transcript_600/m.1881 type:complete len:247 (+) Transcript_600:1042-1782(+)
MSSRSSLRTRSSRISISLLLSTWSCSSWRASMRAWRSRSIASWHRSRTNSWGGRVSRSCSRRSQTLRGAHLERRARCSWKRHSPSCRIVSSTDSTRSSRALTMSSVRPIFLRMVLFTRCVFACNWRLVWPWTAWLSSRLCSACFARARAWFRPSTVRRSHAFSWPTQASPVGVADAGPLASGSGGSSSSAASPKLTPERRSSSSSSPSRTPSSSSGSSNMLCAQGPLPWGGQGWRRWARHARGGSF